MEDLVHIPPRPSRIVFHLAGSLALSIGLWALGLHFTKNGSDGWTVLKNYAVCVGVLPGLLTWHLFGRRDYRSVVAQDYALGGPEIYPSPERFRLLQDKKLPFGAVLERSSAPSGSGYDNGQLLCFRFDDVRSWMRPVMLFHYLATPVLFWEACNGSYEICLVGPAAWLGILITFWWLWLDSPWVVIAFRQGACHFESDDIGYDHGRQVGACIVRGVPEEDGLRLTLEDGKQHTVYFPGGSLSPKTQQAIALDLFRHHGIPTEEEDNPAAGVYR